MNVSGLLSITPKLYIQQQAFAHSKIKVKLNNKDIKAIIQQVEVDTKRVFKKQPLDAISKSDMSKIERDSNRM